MPNRSLENHLFSRTLPVLPWKTRLEIMLGAAEGLAYLHEGLEIQVPQNMRFVAISFNLSACIIYLTFSYANIIFTCFSSLSFSVLERS